MDKRSEHNKGFAAMPVLLGAAVVVMSAVILYFGVQRVKDLQTVLQRPKAVGSVLGDIRGCKYTTETPINGSLCQTNGASGQKLTLYDSGGNKKDDSTNQPFGPLDTPGAGNFRNLTGGNSYTMKADSLAGYQASAQYCVNKHVCLLGDYDAFCRTYPGDQCTGSLPKATVVSGNEVSVTIPTDDATYDNPAKFVEIFWQYRKGGSNGSGNYKAISPVGGNSSLTPTFSWTGTMPATNTYKNICIGTWVDSSTCESLGCRDVTGRDSYVMPTALSPNTAYGWTVYSAASGGGSPTNMSGGCQQFTTGSGGVTGDVIIHASGTPGAGVYPQMQLRVNNNVIQTWTVSGTPTDYGASVPGIKSSDQVSVWFRNDFYNGPADDRNLRVDSVKIGATTIASDDPAVLTVFDTDGPFGTNNTCPAGNTKSVWLNCQGHFVYNSTVSTCVDSQCDPDAKCVNNHCVTFSCDPQTCNTISYVNHACKYTNQADGTACGTAGSGNTCQKGVCTAPTVECDADSKCSDDKKCNLTTNKCVVPTCTPDPSVCQTAEYKNHACSLKNKADGTACETNKVCSNGSCVSSEVNSCWDNKGTNGKCYDCNGDGTVNILDFSCFQKHWLENVQ